MKYEFVMRSEKENQLSAAALAKYGQQMSSASIEFSADVQIQKL